MKRRSRAVGLIAIAVATSIVTGCSTTVTPATSATTLSDGDLRIATAVAHREAARSDPSHPGADRSSASTDWPAYVTGVQAVGGLIRGDAQQYLDSSSTDETPVVLVRLTGRFAAIHSGPPPASPSATDNTITDGTALEVIADASTGEVLDLGIGQAARLPVPRGAQTLFLRSTDSARPSTTPTLSTSTTTSAPVVEGTDHRYTTTESPKRCTSAQIAIVGSVPGGAGLGTRHLPVLLRNTGADCLLASASSRIVIDGRTADIGHASAPRGAVIAANSFASLDVTAPIMCPGGRSTNISDVEGTEPVVLRIDGVDRRLPHPFPRTTCTAPSVFVMNGIAFAVTPTLPAASRHLELTVDAPIDITPGPLAYTVTVTDTDTGTGAVTLPHCLSGTQDLRGLDLAGTREITVTQTDLPTCARAVRLATGDATTFTVRTTVPIGQAWTLAWTLEDGPTGSTD